MPVGFWTGIQVHYDAEMAKMQLGDRWEREVKKYDPAAWIIPETQILIEELCLTIF